MSTPVSHAFVLPDENFPQWLQALQPYLSKFERVAVIRSPSGNDLNPYRNVTAVTAPKMWMQDDPKHHIRRIYPQVVRVDVVNAKTPQEMATKLQARITANDRYGEKSNSDGHIHDRFILEWATDYRPTKVTKVFTTAPSNSPDDNFGVDIATAVGSKVLASADGIVTRQWAGNGDDSLKLGKYIQVTSRYGNTNYIISYIGLSAISVPLNTPVKTGDEIGRAASTSIRIAVQAEGGGRGYHLPNIVDPMPMLYITNLRVRPTGSGLRIRSIPSLDGEVLGQLSNWDLAIPKEQHGRVLAKVGVEGEWVRVRMPDGRDGYAAAWFLEATTYKRLFEGINPVGVNLDQLHPLGTPDPSRLGKLGWVRFGFNVSNNTGSEDIVAAYNRYAPLAEKYVRAGYKVLFATSHQTYGEGKNEYWPWPQMTDDKWLSLTDRFADMMNRVSKQWAGKGLVHCWQVWNEQDAPIGAVASVPMTAQNYGKMLNKVVPAIKSMDKEVYVITGGHTAGPGRGSDYAKVAVGMLKPDAMVDGIATHPYGRGPNPQSIYAPFGHIDDEIKAYAAVMPDKPLWITEWGVLDRPNDSPQDIGNYALDFISYVKAKYSDKIACLIWYAWAQGMHNGYGIVDTSSSPRQPFTDRFLQS